MFFSSTSVLRPGVGLDFYSLLCRVESQVEVFSFGISEFWANRERMRGRSRSAEAELLLSSS
jgi:hypothetical protein